MGKHFNANVWRECDSWRTREPAYDEPLTDAEREAYAVAAEDYAHEAEQLREDYGVRVRRLPRSMLMRRS